MKIRKAGESKQQAEQEKQLLLSKPNRTIFPHSKTQSLIFHTHSSLYTHASLESSFIPYFNPQSPTPNNHQQPPKVALFKNWASDNKRVRRFTKNAQEIAVKKYFCQNKTRRQSQTFIIDQHQQIQKERSKTHYFKDQLSNSKIQTNRSASFLQNRKFSFNTELLGFSKYERKNSGNNERAVQARVIKKKRTAWQQNNNFQLSMATNSSDTPNAEEISENITNLPKTHILRKQSENQHIRKTPPSFILNKSHRRSMDHTPLPRKVNFKIQSFMILKELGSGTFGRVVLGVQRESKMMCAIKMVSKRMIRQNNMEQQLIRQMKIQSFANHPNIIKVYGFFDDLQHFYIRNHQLISSNNKPSDSCIFVELIAHLHM